MGIRFGGINALLSRDKVFTQLVARLREPRWDGAIRSPDNSLPCLITELWQKLQCPIVIIAPRPGLASLLSEQLFEWMGDAPPLVHFPEKGGLPLESYIRDTASTSQRTGALAMLHSTAPIVTTSIRAVSQTTVAPHLFAAGQAHLKTGMEINLGEFCLHLSTIGYQHASVVNNPGEFARRGGILDIYPAHTASAIRVELFGDTVDEIRLVDPVSQRSSSQLDEISVWPASEILPLLEPEPENSLARAMIDALENHGCPKVTLEPIERMLLGEDVANATLYDAFFQPSSLIEHLAERDGLLLVLRPGEVEESSTTTDYRHAKLLAKKIGRNELSPRFPSPHFTWSQLREQFTKCRRRVGVSPWSASAELPSIDATTLALPFSPTSLSRSSMNEAVIAAAALAKEGRNVVIASPHALRIMEILRTTDGATDAASLRYADDLTEGIADGLTTIDANLREGFTLEAGHDSLTVLTDRELIGVVKQRLPRKTRLHHKKPVTSESLTPGMYVVHVDHGIARFEGMHTPEKNGREFLLLRYAEEDRLYVPMDRLDSIQIYKGGRGISPRLTRLGSNEWERTKSRIRKASELLASELLTIYAAREITRRWPAEVDTPWQQQMESAFPYEETPAQLAVIEDVKADMESNKPLDRLICGDVGYGKTEVALRAAFKAVMSGHQVAVLAPTTVLAAQHFETFSERFAPFPVIVGMLSRFRSAEEQRATIARISKGEVDVVIGTHRILQRDVSFSNLRLLIIDEEHKFGVAHKQYILRNRADVDVLSLSATPIPRTLHMALAGARDMSSLDTPPEDRVPIKTYIGEDSDEIVREAILREMDRSGQVFALHNRVHDIHVFAARVQGLVPTASIGVAHGQMDQGLLEEVMRDFAHLKYDILVCTTIIESGLDLPNVNTLIIDSADKFGLAQLHQLRGRVGRGYRRAYAYLLVPKTHRLSLTAERRLNVILQANELGVGYQLAVQDMEIRGVGSILGAEQSGYIAAIGLELYSQLLANTVKELRGENVEVTENLSDIKVHLGIEANIPATYIDDLPNRLYFYRRFLLAEDTHVVDEICAELRDRFGVLPQSLIDLALEARVRIVAASILAHSVTIRDNTLTVALQDGVGNAARLLAKQLGPNAKVGNRVSKITLTTEEKDHTGRAEEVIKVLITIANFRSNILGKLQAAVASG